MTDPDGPASDDRAPDDERPTEAADATTDIDGRRRRGRHIGRRIASGVAASIVIALLAAAVPVSSSDLGARPDPTSSYDDGLARISGVSAIDVVEPCRSQLYDHGERTERVVVLFHGLTNCPVVTLPRAGLPYDVIDPPQPDSDVDLVYPPLLALLGGDR